MERASFAQFLKSAEFRYVDVRVLHATLRIQLDCYLRVTFNSSYGFNVDDRQVWSHPTCQIASAMRALACAPSTIQPM